MQSGSDGNASLTRTSKLKTVAIAGLALAAVALGGQADAAGDIRRVLLISVDGMHAVDLSNYIATHHSGALAALRQHGVVYPAALTSAPSDSFPGLLAQLTGGTPKTHGVFYDVSYDRELFAPGSNCAGSPGTQTTFDESVDVNSKVLNAGGTPGQPLTQIDPAKLPMRLVNGKCRPVYPHEFIKTNTIFEVIRAAGGRTAWADKHPAYDLVNGPSGQGVVDLFTPEVDSNDPITGADTTTGFHSIQRNDAAKVQAVLNEIQGLDSTGQNQVGVPRIFGMNFQAVSVGQKLAAGNPSDPQDAGLKGGYLDAIGRQPNTGLAANLDFVDAQLGAMMKALEQRGLLRSTLVIVSAKHGQSPINLGDRAAVSDGPYANIPGYDASITDDVGLVWLKPGLQEADYRKAAAFLEVNAAQLGISKLLKRDALTKLYQDPFKDNRTPDFIAITNQGLIYTGGTKLAEHGGFSNDDRSVALLVSNPSLQSATIPDTVQTTQIAPTILESLNLDPRQLEGARIENTQALPGLTPITRSQN